MADLSITPANVVPGANAVIEYGTAGEAVAAGKAGYYDEAQQKYFLADSNSATAAVRKARGIFVNSAATGQPCALQRGGDLAMGAVFTANTPYYLSDTAGGICPLAEVGAGEYLCQIGIAKSTAVITVDPQSTGVAN